MEKINFHCAAMFPNTPTIIALVSVIFFFPIVFGYGNFVDPESPTLNEKRCGNLYSGANHSGNVFVFSDFDQSMNMKRDYRSTTAGWWSTGSVRVEGNCSINICSGTYFQGACQSLTHGNHYSSAELYSGFEIGSANCTCARECSCRNISIPKHRWGRAYLKGGCRTCDSEYIELSSDYSWFPSEYWDSVEALILRKGCTMSIYSEKQYEGDIRLINTERTENFSARVGSYRIHCDSNAFDPPDDSPSLTKSDASLIQLTATNKDLLTVFSTNTSLSTHPALKAALRSFESGRSPRNVYVLMIDSELPVYFYLDSRHYYWCTEYSDIITECQIPVTVDKLGISTAQVRVIHAQIAGSNDTEEDYRMLASLDNYLSNHEDLKDAIPNAVIVLHEFYDYHFSESGSIFRRKLQAVSSLRTLVIDEKYSNVIFLLYKAFWMGKVSEERLDQFTKFLEDDRALPMPTHVIPAFIYANVPKVNGHWKLRSGEYFPRNLYKKLALICEQGGDPLGNAILTALFQNEHQFARATLKTEELVPKNHCRVNLYRQLATNPVIMQNLSNYFKRSHNKHRRLMGEQVGTDEDLEGQQTDCEVLEEVQELPKIDEQQTESPTFTTTSDSPPTTTEEEQDSESCKVGNTECPKICANDKLQARVKKLEEKFGKFEQMWEEIVFPKYRIYSRMRCG